MTDGKLAVIGSGSIGSMALRQASRLSYSVTGFEALSPAHGRIAVGGDTRLFRMLETTRFNVAEHAILSRAEWPNGIRSTTSCPATSRQQPRPSASS